jgi:hypothetical protein
MVMVRSVLVLVLVRCAGLAGSRLIRWAPGMVLMHH